MDRHGIGREREAKVADWYRARGCVVWQPPRTKYQAQDIFGVGDLLCVKTKHDDALICYPSVFMVQVCDKKSVKRHRDAVVQWNEDHGDYIPCYLVVWDPKRYEAP